MDLFTIAAIVIALSAVFGYVNVRVLKLPNTIGLMVVAIAFTLFLFASSLVTDKLLVGARAVIGAIDFETILLDIMLGFLLFAGAMHTNFDQLKIQRWPVLVFATLGVLVSTFLIAILVYFLFQLLGFELKFIHCLLFGALISPTDPIAVLGILKKCGVPKKLETKIVGESLFNDGVGVVVFLTIMAIASGGNAHHDDPSTPAGETASAHVQDHGDEVVPNESASEQDEEHTDDHASSGDVTFPGIAKLFLQEVIGGIALGLLLGFITYKLLRSIDDYEIEVLITLACVMGGYALAHWLHLSAPLAIVVAGLMVGHDTTRDTAMSRQTEEYVDLFWELMDIMMNAILFVLIGLELLVISFQMEYLQAGMLAIVIVLVSRYLSLLAPVAFFRKKLDFVPHTTTIMAWGGLRGGISIALALSLKSDMNRELFLTVTYVVVVFSIVVQALTVGPLARRLIGSDAMQDQKETVH